MKMGDIKLYTLVDCGDFLCQNTVTEKSIFGYLSDIKNPIKIKFKSIIVLLA